MADLTAKKMELSQINGGKQYTNADGLQAKTINAVVESGAWVQKLATNQPNTSQANVVGTPSVTIGTMSDGTPQLVFANLKGATGAQGPQGPQGDTYVLTSDDKTAIAQIVYGMLPFYNGEHS